MFLVVAGENTVELLKKNMKSHVFVIKKKKGLTNVAELSVAKNLHHGER